MTRLLLLGGAGNTGRRLASLFAARGDAVTVTTRRDPADVAALLPPGTTILRADPTVSADDLRRQFASLPAHDVVIDLLGAFLIDPRRVVIDATRNVIDALPDGPPPRFVFCGTTAVYGHRPGEVLDEDSPTKPDFATGRLHIEAEDFLMSSHRAGRIDAMLLRLPHVYGPGREKLFDIYRQGGFVVFGDGRNNMQHLYVEDFVAALVRAADRGVPGGIVVNVVDDPGRAYREYPDFVTDWCGHPRLPAVTLDEALATGVVTKWLGPRYGSGEILGELYRNLTANITLRNDRLRGVLGVDLRYPSLDDGLAEMLTLAGEPDRRKG